MECIRGESKLNIKTLNRTLKFSLKRTGSHTTYQYPYIRFIMNRTIPWYPFNEVIKKK